MLAQSVSIEEAQLRNLELEVSREPGEDIGKQVNLQHLQSAKHCAEIFTYVNVLNPILQMMKQRLRI